MWEPLGIQGLSIALLPASWLVAEGRIGGFRPPRQILEVLGVWIDVLDTLYIIFDAINDSQMKKRIPLYLDALRSFVQVWDWISVSI